MLWKAKVQDGSVVCRVGRVNSDYLGFGRFGQMMGRCVSACLARGYVNSWFYRKVWHNICSYSGIAEVCMQEAKASWRRLAPGWMNW